MSKLCIIINATLFLEGVLGSSNYFLHRLSLPVTVQTTLNFETLYFQNHIRQTKPAYTVIYNRLLHLIFRERKK